jgi:hypothetical protein
MTSILPSEDPNKKIVPKDTERLSGFEVEASRVEVGGGSLTADVEFHDKLCDLLSETTFEDAYQVSPVWEGGAAPPAEYSATDEQVASVDQEGLVTRQSGGSCRAAMKARGGTYLTRELSLGSATRPAIHIMKGYLPGTLGASSLGCFLSATQGRLAFPSGDINYDPSWGLDPTEDVVVIDGPQQYASLADYNLSHPEAANKVYIDKSSSPNRMLKWNPFKHNGSGFGGFEALRRNEVYIIQNDGRWVGSPQTNDGIEFGPPKYRANPFFYDFDFSGVSVYNSDSDSWTRRTKTGTLVTKRHMVHAKHANYTPAVGATVRFVSRQGLVVERTVQARYTAPGDFGMTMLDEDVPDDIAVYPAFGSDLGDHFPAAGQKVYYRNDGHYRSADASAPFTGCFSILCDQEKNAQPHLLENLTNQTWDSALFPADQTPAAVEAPLGWNPSGQGPVMIPIPPDFLEETALGIEYKYGHGGVPGDSGSPVFVPIAPYQMVLAGLDTGSLPSLNPSPSQDGPSINEIIQGFGATGYEAAAADLSAFRTF